MLGTIAALVLSVSAAPAGESPADAAAVHALLDRQVAAWNRGDLEAFMATYWRSPDLVYQSNGSVTRGWEPTLARYRKRYQAEGRQMGRLRFDGLRVEVLAPAAAFASGGWHLTFADGKGANGLFTLLLRKLPGEGWRIVHDHSSADPPAESAAKPAVAPPPP